MTITLVSLTGGRDLVFGDHENVAAWAVPFLAPAIESVADLQPLQAIGICCAGQPIAAVIYNNFNGHDIHMTIATNTPRWASRAVLRALFVYPFLTLGVARVTATTGKGNSRAQRLLEGVGFRQEGAVRLGILGREDALLYGMLRQECRWVEGLR